MRLARFFSLLLIVIVGGLLLFLLKRNEFIQKLDPTLAPAFQTAGRYSQSVDRLIAKVIPVDSLDEKEFGEVILHSLKKGQYLRDDDDPTVIYLNRAFGEVKKLSKKPFDYRIHLTNVPSPNAFALPGGNIVMHIGLLDGLKSEAELISILGHEMGHIELGHCFQSAKYEMLAKKMGGSSLGKLADFATAFFLRNSFSKTQEGEADDYGFSVMVNSVYDPRGMGNAFATLKDLLNSQRYREAKERKIDFVRDYYLSHPPLDLRIEKFHETAKVWWRTRPVTDQRYVGVQNIQQSISFSEKQFDGEWISN